MIEAQRPRIESSAKHISLTAGILVARYQQKGASAHALAVDYLEQFLGPSAERAFNWTLIASLMLMLKAILPMLFAFLFWSLKTIIGAAFRTILFVALYAPLAVIMLPFRLIAAPFRAKARAV